MATGMQRLNESSIFFSFSSGERCSFKVEVGCELAPITNSNTMRQTGRASSSNILWIREQRSDLKTYTLSARCRSPEARIPIPFTLSLWSFGRISILRMESLQGAI